MKHLLLSQLRDKNTTINQFRVAADKLGFVLANDVSQHIEKEKYYLETPLGEHVGTKIKNKVILVPILRSGLALLFPFLKFFESAHVGFVGLQRDEKSAIAKLYYDKVPPIKKNNTIILLDPMIATGGSAVDALKILVEKGASEEKIVFAAVIAAQEGLDRVKAAFPKIKIIIPEVDEILNDKKYIVPGLGDFGDRFFGTEGI